MFTEAPYQLSDLDQGLTGRLRYHRGTAIDFADESRSRGNVSAASSPAVIDFGSIPPIARSATSQAIPHRQEEAMKPIFRSLNLSITAAPVAATTVVKAALFAGV